MDMNNKKKEESLEKEFLAEEQGTTNVQAESVNESEKKVDTDNMTDQQAKVNLEEKYKELNDSHLRLMAEFDNYRKRTLREKAELIKTGSESALTNLLPVIDDFERALSTIQHTEDITAVVQGVELIYNKFISYLSQQGIKVIEIVGQPFNIETSEAIATIPAPEEDLKGKVLDCVQPGYMLHDKVIRHAKVVVGE
jgi:molecular chaperone GrpE